MSSWSMTVREFAAGLPGWAAGEYQLTRYGRVVASLTFRPGAASAVPSAVASVSDAAAGVKVPGLGDSDRLKALLARGRADAGRGQAVPVAQVEESPGYARPPAGLSGWIPERRRAWVAEHWPELDGDEGLIVARLRECEG